MSIQPLEGANPLTKSRLARFADIAMRILAVAIGYTIVSRLLSFSIPSFSSTYLQALLIDLITGGVSALVLLPLARRLPYRMWVRIIALFLPLYWIAVYGNIVEAYFYTTYSPVS